jgi:thioredoxin 1
MDNVTCMGLFSKRVKAQQLMGLEDFDSAVASGKPVFIDFMKHGCQPCQVMDGIVNELADEFGEDAVVLKANLANVPELFARFKVKATPTFILVTPHQDGLHQRFRHSGLVKKDQLVAHLERAIAAI